MFDKVIVGVDGSQGGHDAIALARRLVKPGATVTFVHLYGGRTAGGRAAALAMPFELEAAERLLARETRRSGLVAEPVAIYESSVGHGLHKLARQQDADLLVVGSCQRGILGRAFLGDDTSRALNGAPCAVAIAPRGYGAAAPASLHLASIGLGCDETQLVVDELHHPDDLQGVEGEATYGDPGEELSPYSDDLDLMIVGPRSYGRAGRLFKRSTSNYLARRTRCPLLVLPRSAGRAIDTGATDALAGAHG